MSARIFISYARSDGSVPAESLIQFLAANNHSAWQDQRDLGPEKTAWPQIETALKTAEFQIVLITPAALKSEYIRKEWREARRYGATIIPVMAMEQSRSTLPRWLRRGEVYDLAKPAHREKFLARLNTTGGTFLADWDAGLEIETFIARPRLFTQIKTQLLSEVSEPFLLTSALQGRGGYGKSVLAGEIARDPEVRDAYIDGVFWVSLGQDNPDVLGQINHLIRRVSGAGGAPDVNTAAEELRRLLEKRDVLIILDDVWRRQDLYPFAKATGQGNATLLATTRKLDALPPSAQTIDISGMEPDEAVALLSYGLEPDAAEQQALSAFASAFWYWPQLLAIANGLLRGRLRDGDTLLHALETIADGGRRGVVPGIDERERNIANVMQMGIDDLHPSDRDRFKVLSVVPEDTAIPVAILAPIWGLSQYKAEEFARLLLDRRLIQSRDLSDPAVGARIRVHDDMLWYLGATTDEASRRGLHIALLTAHRPTNANWAELKQQRPALHYLWLYLIWHLEQAGEVKTANALRVDYAWIKAKLTLLGIDGLLTDYRARPTDRCVALVGNALQLSRHALDHDRGQLGFQLFGRLSQQEGNEFKNICEIARNDIPFFAPVSLKLNPPGAEMMQMLEHERSVISVAFSPDGSRIVSGNSDGTLCLWDAATGAAYGAPLCGHEDSVFSVSFSPDGRRIASGSYDNTLRLWDAASGIALSDPLRLHESLIKSVSFSPDSRYIISWSISGTLHFWDAATGEALGETLLESLSSLLGHVDVYNTDVLSNDGNYIFSRGDNCTVCIWCAFTGEVLGEFWTGDDDQVRTISVSPDGSRIVGGGSMTHLWDAVTGAVLELGETFRCVMQSVSCVAFSPDSSKIISGSFNGTLRLWDASTGAALREPISGHEGLAINSVAFSPDGSRIVSGGDDGTLRLWSTSGDAAMCTPLTERGSCVLSIAFSADGNRCVSGSMNGTLQLWEVNNGAILGSQLHGHQSYVTSVDISNDGCHIISASNDQTLRYWDTNSGASLVLRGSMDRKKIDDLLAVVFSPDGSRIVSGVNNRLRMWHCNGGTLLGNSLHMHKKKITTIAFSPDGSRIVSGGEDCTLCLWDSVADRLLRNPLRGHKDTVTSVAFSPDGNFIVSGSRDCTLRLWDAITGAALGEPFRVNGCQVESVTFSPDGRYIIGSTIDRTLRFWDFRTGALITTFNFDSVIFTVSTSNTHLAVGDRSGYVHILHWKLSNESASTKTPSCT